MEIQVEIGGTNNLSTPENNGSAWFSSPKQFSILEKVRVENRAEKLIRFMPGRPNMEAIF